jgi:hypothetical protein
LARRTGLPDRVMVDDVPDELKRGMSFSHNHPNGGNFSRVDVLAACGYALAELRVVTPVFRMSLRPHSRIWPSPRLVDATWAQIEPQSQWRTQLALASGQFDPRDAQAQLEHERLKLLASQLSLRYIRERS